jgi:hypothetical protein
MPHTSKRRRYLVSKRFKSNFGINLKNEITAAELEPMKYAELTTNWALNR